MEIKMKKNIIIIAVVVTIALSILIITAGFAASAKKESPGECVLASYENTVALFIDGELEEVYSDIVLNTLPKQDIDQLNHGIYFSTVDEARRAIEDYDG
ncbi:MAG: hypothetical protein J6J39_01465 [Clostridia bacterium]|nr:hypothetical protein [Clostridia bacterium]